MVFILSTVEIIGTPLFSSAITIGNAEGRCLLNLLLLATSKADTIPSATTLSHKSMRLGDVSTVTWGLGLGQDEDEGKGQNV